MSSFISGGQVKSKKYRITRFMHLSSLDFKKEVSEFSMRLVTLFVLLNVVHGKFILLCFPIIVYPKSIIQKLLCGFGIAEYLLLFHYKFSSKQSHEQF